VALPLEKLGSTYPPRTALIDPDRARQYAAATNDHNPAYEAGKVAPPVFGIIAHGLCTMAMCSQSVITTVAGEDPTRVPRLAVRFAANVLPGNDVVTEVY
jgi:acyl dehydratase